MNTRQAFRGFMRFHLKNGEGITELGLNGEDIENFIAHAEGDRFFYDRLDDFLKEFIEIHGESYGIKLS
ncbi:hypothetical protein [Bacillus pumilus]|uniref:hypothetical protein n=1 Tax=Bacillus pumilus TaxID=1408 RepID=UPI0011A760BE|nr:hypothetical protein [Bacillus pumilus]